MHKTYERMIVWPEYKNGLFENSVGTDRSEEMGAGKKDFNLKYVTTVGIFRVNHRRIAPPATGVITSVGTCRLWSDPEHPLPGKDKPNNWGKIVGIFANCVAGPST